MTTFLEHTEFIHDVVQSARALPHISFLAKLHAKDDPELWHAELQKNPARNMKILPASRGRFGRDIFAVLAGARALVTRTSTAALDAMILDVPAISLRASHAAPSGLPFIDDGVIERTTDVASLVHALQRAWAQDVNPWVARQRAYRVQHFAHLGSATEAACDALLELMSP